MIERRLAREMPAATDTSSRLVAIGQELPEHRLFLWTIQIALMPAAERLAARDAAICDARRFYAGSASGIAKRLASDWSAYLAAAWIRERAAGPPVSASAKREALWHLSYLAAGQALSWRQVLRILDEAAPSLSSDALR